jgi:HK97 gp10 family phage protein
VADGVTVNVNGLYELEKAMLGLNDRLHQRVIRRGLVAGGQLIRNQARANAPVLKGVEHITGPRNDQHIRGQLRRAIVLKYDKPESTKFVKQYIIAVRHGKKFQAKNMDAYYWYMLEFGTKGHIVKSKDAQLLSDGSTAFGTRARIPAQQANPFMRNAFNIKQGEAFNVVRYSWGDGIAQEVARK